jgi:hypothetical protein
MKKNKLKNGDDNMGIKDGVISLLDIIDKISKEKNIDIHTADREELTKIWLEASEEFEKLCKESAI